MLVADKVQLQACRDSRNPASRQAQAVSGEDKSIIPQEMQWPERKRDKAHFVRPAPGNAGSTPACFSEEEREPPCPQMKNRGQPSPGKTGASRGGHGLIPTLAGYTRTPFTPPWDQKSRRWEGGTGWWLGQRSAGCKEVLALFVGKGTQVLQNINCCEERAGGRSRLLRHSGGDKELPEETGGKGSH